MKKVCLSLFVLVAVVGLVGCGGGGSSKYNFNGTWAASYVVISGGTPAYPVGSSFTGTAVIHQNGTDFVIQLGTQVPQRGSCDPKAKTFSASAVDGIAQLSTTGRAEDKDTLSGEHVITVAYLQTRIRFTMDLITRDKSSSRGLGGSTAGSAEEGTQAAISSLTR